MKTVSVKLPEVLAAKLKAAARKQKTSQAALLREALETYFANGSGPFISAYDLAPELAGCLDSGGGDLSYNPKHMEGFGE